MKKKGTESIYRVTFSFKNLEGGTNTYTDTIKAKNSKEAIAEIRAFNKKIYKNLKTFNYSAKKK